MFEEYLATWDFADRWRPVVEHLAARLTSWPPGAPDPEDICVDYPVDVLWTEGLLVWAWLDDQHTCIGGQIDDWGLRCGELNAHNPGDSLQTQLAVPTDTSTLQDLTDTLLNWMAQKPTHRSQR